MQGYNQMDYSSAYRQAERRVKVKLDFYRHLSSYVIVNGMLIAIYLLTAIPSGLYYPWFIWPMAGWGIGLLFHFLSAFVFGSALDTQKMIEEEMRRMQR